ncbi:MAG: DUF1080 domain-containing protein [Dysgonamonadaceae bacterium]|nr:DUF1080 domain-containing protein [Dysgonamonadaceae bacterium]MDD4727877.1 DUF1080 domain-containing protein [Dysgonamonadaceae bacterium]
MKPICTILKQIFLLFTIALFAHCTHSSNQTKQEEKPNENNLEQMHENSIFDRKTLDGWEITQFGTQGAVFVSEGKIVLEYGDGCTGITSTKDIPKMDYEVALDARKTSGNDFFCGITFPVNDSFCSLIVGGWGGSVLGLSNINGQDADHNETRVWKKFENDVWYTIKLRVTQSTIVAWIDNEKLVDYPYKEGELGIRNEVNLSTPLGICSFRTTAELRNITLKELDTLDQ